MPAVAVVNVPSVVITDGTSDADVKAASTAPVATDKALVVAVSPNTPALAVTDGGGSLTVDGPLTDAELRATAVPVSDGGGSLTVDTPQLPAALVGGRLDVVVGAALPAGTNRVGGVRLLDDADTALAFVADLASVQRVPAQTMPARKISTANSSTANLGSGATFTGTGEDTDGYVAITVAVYASHASATDGLKLEYSADNTNWRWDDVFTLAAGAAKVFRTSPVARYFRVRYVNGGTTQTTFELSTTLHATQIKPSTHRLADSISAQDDAELVKALLSGITDAGSTLNIGATDDNRLKVATPTPAAPTGTTAVSQYADGDVGANATSQLNYTIPNGDTLHIQRLTMGGEASVSGGRVILLYRPNGSGSSSGEEVLGFGYISGGNFQSDLDGEFTGNGTRAVVLQRINNGGTTIRMTALWVGYTV